MPTLPNRLHIIAFDIPYPADYGGVIDIYHKVKALHQQGVEVILHMYTYGRKKSVTELQKYTAELYYYKRNTFKNPFIGSKPYIVNTRNGEAILDRLLQDQAPILFEGLHCTFHLKNPLLRDRYKIVRTHNVEHHYYKHLERSEFRYFKKYFFRIEAEKLRKYESILKYANQIAAISPNDTSYFSKKFENVFYLPAFHSNDNTAYAGPKGDYLLYHGNLSVPENYTAAIALVNNVFSKLSIDCIIAGNNPPKELEDLCERYDHISLQSSVTTNKIHKLIEKAHVNVLYTDQNTGIKLKLLNALYLGKFAVVNPLMVEGSGLESLCAIGDNFDEMKTKIEEYLRLDFTQKYFDHRKDILDKNFGVSAGAHKLIEHIDFESSTGPVRKSDMNVMKRLSQLSSFMSYFSL